MYHATAEAASETINMTESDAVGGGSLTTGS
jgi:hypothetical protein